MHLVRLQSETLIQAQQLAADLFPWEEEHQHALASALDPAAHAGFYAARGLSTVRFSVLLHENRVSGLAGLYQYASHPDESWLAWFGLCPGVRGRGEGAALLDAIIAESRAEGRQALRLWTTDEDEYARATALYLSRGFRSEPWPALPGETWHTWVLSLGLAACEPLPWARVASGHDLCGRVVPGLVAA